MQKGFTTIHILLIVVILVVAGLIYSGKLNINSQKALPTPIPTPEISQVNSEVNLDDETANWKTYKDPDNKFELKYPSDFKQISKNDVIVFEKTGDNQKSKADSLSLSVKSLNNYRFSDDFSQTFYSYDANKKQWISSNGSDEFLPKRVEGDLEIYTSGVGGGLCTGDRILIPSPSRESMIEMISIICLESTEDTRDIKEISKQRTKQILSTFKFNR